jgi:hypothetical protein
MFSYLVETSRNGVTWVPDTTFAGKLPYTRAQQYVDTVPGHLYVRITRLSTGRIMEWSYPSSFDLGDVLRDL